MLRICLSVFGFALLGFVNLAIAQTEALPEKPIVKLSPTIHHQHSTASYPSDFAQNPFDLTQVQIIDADASKTVSRVIGNVQGRRLIDGREPIIISGRHAQQAWAIYREISYYQRETAKVVVIRKIADARLEFVNEEHTSLQVTDQSQEIAANDIALATALLTRNQATLTAVSSATVSSAEIVGTLAGTNYVGENQSVILNRGSDDGLLVGHVFELLDDFATDMPQLSERHIGQLVVTHLHPRFSIAVVSESVEAIGLATKIQPAKFQ
ncbi:hypothetical protein [Vibrio sp. M260118]|uniref:hypothetical protein n=1 Tax=Vibrio sp. M260118 TaxID=3020896 RepID=UPI002F420EE7